MELWEEEEMMTAVGCGERFQQIFTIHQSVTPGLSDDRIHCQSDREMRSLTAQALERRPKAS